VTDGRSSYVGRFAPSPTGPLHYGSLLAAIASYAQARVSGGQWLVRIEDIDPPREQPGSDQLILRALERFGFEWDGEVVYQSSFATHHEALIQELLEAGQAYRCSCSRRDLADAPRGSLGTIYPGNCRNGCSADEFAIRVLTDDSPIEFEDAIQGKVSQRLESESGDFVIKRRDGLVAYNFAVVVDDADQGITEVVRGVDLLDSTPRHIHLQRLMKLPTPAYMHIPVAVNPDGQKLSKLTGARAIDERRPGDLLFDALRALDQGPPDDLASAEPEYLWEWLFAHWNPGTLAGRTEVPTDGQRFGPRS
jgi:glutamyl-Q tRNA(Asp) synthetase